MDLDRNWREELFEDKENEMKRYSQELLDRWSGKFAVTAESALKLLRKMGTGLEMCDNEINECEKTLTEAMRNCEDMHGEFDFEMRSFAVKKKERIFGTARGTSSAIW